MFQGYWNTPHKTADAFAELDGKQFFRSGGLAYMDEMGFFFFADHLKRMINASRFKVWPAKVDAVLYQHSAAPECCIVAALQTKNSASSNSSVNGPPGER